MQQRRLRLGDILDDYCPRERRITNHVVVAMIDDDVKQTRCSTCDADHEYKQGKSPIRRKREMPLSPGQMLDAPERPRPVFAPGMDAAHADDAQDEFDGAEAVAERAHEPVPAPLATPAAEAAPQDDVPPQAEEDNGPVHRRLIRATLPRPLGESPERKVPDFTIHQPSRGRQNDRDRNGRPNRGRRGGGVQGGQGDAQPRFGGGRHGQQGHAQGQNNNRNAGGRHGGGGPGQSRGGGQPGQNRAGGGAGRKRGR